jgi:FkbM family methyltransferase
MNLNIQRDLWQYLAASDKKIVMYGMGNGADKILRICESRGIEVCDFFASDGFVRGHSFHGKTVLSYSAVKEKYGAENIIVLLSFASSLDGVIENILRVASECELYAPDVPVFGDTLFDMAFYLEHESEIDLVYEMLSDEESREIYENVIKYKLTGDISYLEARVSDKGEVYRSLLRSDKIKSYADLGAYNGDTVRELAEYAPDLRRAIALEPDKRNFRKLSSYCELLPNYSVTLFNKAIYSQNTTLTFSASGNRNSSASSNGSYKHSYVEVEATFADSLADSIDFIKYDVEGLEYEALLGSKRLIQNGADLLVSMYHKSEDMYRLPLLVKSLYPEYSLFLRRLPYIPAWDLNLYAVKSPKI